MTEQMPNNYLDLWNAWASFRGPRPKRHDFLIDFRVPAQQLETGTIPAVPNSSTGRAPHSTAWLGLSTEHGLAWALRISVKRLL